MDYCSDSSIVAWYFRYNHNEDIATLINKSIMEKYVCEVCDWVYDPAIGDPEGGIAPGTRFEDIPDDWVCPICGVGKDQFKQL